MQLHPTPKTIPNSRCIQTRTQQIACTPEHSQPILWQEADILAFIFQKKGNEMWEMKACAILDIKNGRVRDNHLITAPMHTQKENIAYMMVE